MRDGPRFFKQFNMVLVKMLKYNSEPYIRVMLTYMLWLQHTKTNNPKLYEWLLQNVDALDEERGELTLGKLRECTLRDTDQADCSKLDLNYGLLPLVSEVVKDLQTGKQDDSFIYR